MRVLVSVLTPAGRGAIATILVEGPDCCAAAAHWFQAASRRPLREQPIARVLFGCWKYQDSAEEVVVCRRSEEALEVHCHGGHSAVRRIIDSLREVGCLETSWQEVVSRWESDSLAAAARVALARTVTQRTAAILLDQYRGALRQALVQVASALHSDSHAAAVLLEQLLDRASVGLHLTQPYRVALAGQPNVGKSSLANALIGYRRSIVHDQPGTTRDVLTSRTAFEGWPVELADVAGLRSSSDTIEADGVARARQLLHDADLVLLVSDASRPWSQQEQVLRECFSHALLVHNKADLPQTNKERPAGLYASALTGYGIAQLIHRCVQRLVPTPVPAGAAVPFSSEQIRVLQTSWQRLQEGNAVGARAEIERLLAAGSGDHVIGERGTSVP